MSTTGTNIINVAFGRPEVLTMSSVEIAELTGKRHHNVLRDIEKMLTEIGAIKNDLSSVYQSAQNKSIPCFNLPKNLTLALITGYSAKLRLAVIDRWQALEESQSRKPQAKPAYTIEDFAVALLESKAKNQALLAEVEAAKPAVEFVAEYVEADGLVNTTQVATKLGISARALNILLREHGYKQKTLSGVDVLTMKGVETGWFESKSWCNNGQTGEQIYITPKGVIGITRLVKGE
jgi:anti-repressor protein